MGTWSSEKAAVLQNQSEEKGIVVLPVFHGHLEWAQNTPNGNETEAYNTTTFKFIA